MATRKKTTLDAFSKVCDNFEKLLEKDIDFGKFTDGNELENHAEVESIVQRLQRCAQLLQEKEHEAKVVQNADLGDQIRQVLSQVGEQDNLSDADMITMVSEYLSQKHPE
ncbi:hypothetical protein [Ligilactobacillus saerimneri]|uniref:hypothetical protein n=1 Tax=Ligilactobacillus saerimneri TaxID=228229 RepID=UPI0029423F56|nr:hypothetical protein [Ligilactobacillus saerimneri]